MSAPEFNPQSYTPDGVAVFGSDAQSLVKFFKHPQISKFRSTEAGRPVYDDVIMIEVIQPGERDPVRVLADDFHKHRFPRQWDNFQKGQADVLTGTPLNLLFPNEPGTIKTLEGFNVFTVDQLANLTDTAMQGIPFGRTLVDRAKAYLSTASGGAQFHQMQQTIADLTAKITALSEARAAEIPAPKPGKPPAKAAKEGAGA